MIADRSAPIPSQAEVRRSARSDSLNGGERQGLSETPDLDRAARAIVANFYAAFRR